MLNSNATTLYLHSTMSHLLWIDHCLEGPLHRAPHLQGLALQIIVLRIYLYICMFGSDLFLDQSKNLQIQIIISYNT